MFFTHKSDPESGQVNYDYSYEQNKLNKNNQDLKYLESLKYMTSDQATDKRAIL